MDEDSWRGNHKSLRGHLAAKLQATGRHSTPRRHPRGTQDAPRSHPKDIKKAHTRHTGIIQETPSRLPEGTHRGIQKEPKGTQEPSRGPKGSLKYSVLEKTSCFIIGSGANLCILSENGKR